jgi:hypothetical protein
MPALMRSLRRHTASIPRSPSGSSGGLRVETGSDLATGGRLEPPARTLSQIFRTVYRGPSSSGCAIGSVSASAARDRWTWCELSLLLAVRLRLQSPALLRSELHSAVTNYGLTAGPGRGVLLPVSPGHTVRAGAVDWRKGRAARRSRCGRRHSSELRATRRLRKRRRQRVWKVMLPSTFREGQTQKRRKLFEQFEARVVGRRTGGHHLSADARVHSNRAFASLSSDWRETRVRGL